MEYRPKHAWIQPTFPCRSGNLGLLTEIPVSRVWNWAQSTISKTETLEDSHGQFVDHCSSMVVVLLPHASSPHLSVPPEIASKELFLISEPCKENTVFKTWLNPQQSSLLGEEMSLWLQEDMYCFPFHLDKFKGNNAISSCTLAPACSVLWLIICSKDTWY